MMQTATVSVSTQTLTQCIDLLIEDKDAQGWHWRVMLISRNLYVIQTGGNEEEVENSEDNVL